MKWYLAVLQNCFVFNGRARRSEYWYFVLFNYMILFSFAFIGGLIQMPLLSSIYSLAVFIPTVAVSVRRMHDVGKSGWYCLIPIYNLILACQEGYRGNNEYGPDPKADNLSFSE